MATAAAQEEYVSAFEAERLVQGLRRYKLSDVGSPKWFNQHEALEKLNIQAHKNLAAQNEEYVSEALVSFEMGQLTISNTKVEMLIHDLILFQAWKRKIYPAIKKEAIATNSLSVYFIMYHEATIINLLQVLMYHPGACKTAGDYILDLLAVISEKLVWLVNFNHPSEDSPPLSALLLMATTEEARYEESINDLNFGLAMNCLGIFRSITDNIPDLSLSALNNILLERDLVCILVYLIEKTPWLRRKANSFETFEGLVWKRVEEEDLLMISKMEAQVWLAIMNLLLEKEARKIYQYSKKNQAIVLRLKDSITEELVSQLPPLVDLQRYLEELTLMNPADTLTPSFGIQPISEIDAAIMEGVNVKELIASQLNLLVNMNDQQKRILAQRLADMYDLEQVQDLLEDPKCGKCGKEATQRCSLCKQEWYCGRECQVAAWKNHKSICEVLRQNKK